MWPRRRKDHDGCSDWVEGDDEAMPFPQRPWDPSKEARVKAASQWAAYRDAIDLVEERDLCERDSFG